MKNQNIFYKKLWLVFLFALFLFFGCNDDFLDRYPQNQLSIGTFWTTENDAMMGLTGVYSIRANWTGCWDHGCNLDIAADNGYNKDMYMTFLSRIDLTSADAQVSGYWSRAWSKITACNYFLENIQSVGMDEIKKAEMMAEVRFMRAYQYFWMSQQWGDVPLVTKVLTIEESNEISRDSREQVVDFVKQELTEAAASLPATRPDAEHGRIIKSAALAVKGMLLMSEKEWSAAAATYKEIIDLSVHEIYSDYEDLFLDRTAQTSSEIIMSRIYLEDEGYGQSNQKVNSPQQFQDGFHSVNPVHSLVNAYLMNDGLPVETSPLYNPQKPFENRDPRLYYSIFLPGYTVFRGQVYQAHPDSTHYGDQVPNHGGYSMKKWIDEDFTGDQYSYGGDIIEIRYAEVLIGYLEAKLEAGDQINQALLDQTINQLRGRASVDMPFVTETDPVKLREIVRRERRIELAFEGLRLFDLNRWGITSEALNRNVLGMRITDDPNNYIGNIIIDENGYYIKYKHVYAEHNRLWPIPQRERDINSNLTQNPGY